MSKQSSSELTVGFFVFAILGALIMFTIVLSYDNIFVKSYQLEVKFENVTGLTVGDKAYVHGVDVGRVKEMEILPDGVMVTLTMKYQPTLHEDYVISVKPSSVLGGKFIEISEGGPDAPLFDEGDQILGTEPTDMIAEATETLKVLRGSLEEGGILANVEVAMANFRKVSDDIESGKGTIGKLIKDDAVYNDLKEITENLSAVSERIEKGEGTLGKLLSEDDAIYNDLQDTVASLNKMIAKVAEGEGTLGKIVNDEALYDEIMSALAEVRSLIDDIRETSPVTSLSTIMFGAF